MNSSKADKASKKEIYLDPNEVLRSFVRRPSVKSDANKIGLQLAQLSLQPTTTKTVPVIGCDSGNPVNRLIAKEPIASKQEDKSSVSFRRQSSTRSDDLGNVESTFIQNAHNVATASLDRRHPTSTSPIWHSGKSNSSLGGVSSPPSVFSLARQSSMSPEEKRKKRKTVGILKKCLKFKWLKIPNRQHLQSQGLSSRCLGYQDLMEDAPLQTHPLTQQADYTHTNAIVIAEFRKAIDLEKMQSTVSGPAIQSPPTTQPESSVLLHSLEESVLPGKEEIDQCEMQQKCALVAHVLELMSEWLTNPGNCDQDKAKMERYLKLMQHESSQSDISTPVGEMSHRSSSTHIVDDMSLPPAEWECLLRHTRPSSSFLRNSLQSSSLRVRHSSECTHDAFIPSRNSQPDLESKVKHLTFTTSPLNEKMRSKGKLYKNEMEDLESLIKRLMTECCNYESYDKAMRKVIRRSGNKTWREVSLLFYITRKLIRRQSMNHKDYPLDQIEENVKKWEEYCMGYFTQHLSGWVQQQGGFDALLEISTDSELD